MEAAPSEREGGGEAEQAEGQNLATPLYEGEVQTQHADGGAAQRQDEAHRAEGDPYLRTQVRQNWIMVGATIVISFATVITTAIGYYQWQAIQKQLASADETSKQTDRLIGAMQKQADAATAQANTSQAIAEQNKELVGHAGEQADASLTQANASQDLVRQNSELVAHAGEQAQASQTQAAASVAQAEAAKQSATAAQTYAGAAERSAQVAERAFTVGERAYLHVRKMTLEKYPVDCLCIRVNYVNAGRLPATLLFYSFRYYQEVCEKAVWLCGNG
jgi:hypothetical protein